ncbi:MAG TPA: four helix bundle protein [Pirellulales bacterium]|nr:four helix bundle protein [Pirellulales bacterium]
MSIQNYRDLIAWQKSMDLAEMVYQATAHFPADERFGLTQQMRRAVVSIPSNIAEGHARRSTQEYRRFLSIANGSRAEIGTQVLLSARLKYFDDAQRANLIEQIEEVGRLINGLLNSLPNRG